MSLLSTNAKEAIKVALAMTVAYNVGLRLEWMNPVWIATSVAFVSMPTAGQSLSKAALRMGGTLLALVAGLFYLGLFPQDRWLFFAAFTPYLAFVTYKMTGRDGQYFWFCAGFVSMMIITAGPGSSEHAFRFAVDRALETLLGIGLWTLVSTFVWPQSNLRLLESTGGKLLDSVGGLVGGLRAALGGTDEAGPQTLRAAAGKLDTALRGTIGAAASESYEVREVRHLWERLHATSVSAMGLLDRMIADKDDLRAVDLPAALPGLDGFLAEVEARFAEAARVLAGAEPSRGCHAVALTVDEAAVGSDDHFRRAALEVTGAELEALEVASLDAVACARELRGHDTGMAPGASRPARVPVIAPFGLPVLDLDRLRGTIMVVAAMWIASLIWIYLDPPGHLGWYMFVPSLAMVVAQIPHVGFPLARPMTYAYLVALTAYVFLMPRLSQFWQLGLLIFAFTWVASYFFAGVGRVALYLSMFLMLGLQNHQTYDFARQANTLLFTVLALITVVALSYIMRSPRQEKAFLSMLGRFFASCEVLVAWAAEPTEQGSLLQRALRAHHLHELRSLPAKLRAWGSQIDTRRFPHNTAQEIEDLVASVQVLAYRVESLLEARAAPQAEFLVRELREDVQAWRVVIGQHFGRWARRPESDPAGHLREHLAARVEALDARVEEAMNKAGDDDVSAVDAASFYRVLGALRGLSTVSIAYAARAGDVDWDHWREERFS